jgi:hypothetical protein
MNFEHKPKFNKVQVSKSERDNNTRTDYNQFAKDTSKKIGNKFDTPNEFINQAKEWDEHDKDTYSVSQLVDFAINNNIEYTNDDDKSLGKDEYIPNIIKSLHLHSLGHIGIDSSMQLITDFSMLMQGLDHAKLKYNDNLEILKKIHDTEKFLLQSTTQYAKGRMEEIRVVSQLNDAEYIKKLGYDPKYKPENEVKLEKYTGLNERELLLNDGIVNGYMLVSILKNMYPHEISAKAYENFVQNNQDLLLELSTLSNQTIKLLILNNKKKDSLNFGLTDKNAMRNMNGVEENGDKENLTEYYKEKNLSSVLRNFGVELLELVESYRKPKN